MKVDGSFKNILHNFEKNVQLYEDKKKQEDAL